MEIRIKDLGKSYGTHRVFDHISLSMGTGMYGLLGKNGAGKTTLMRILATLLEPDTGSVTMNGVDIRDKRKIRGMVGYLPQDFSMYPNMRVAEAMDYLGVLAELPRGVRRERVSVLLREVNLDSERNRRIKELSGGMKRRFGIAQALLNDPEVLIADEPTAGLDPEERVRFGNLLASYARDRIVLLSTHIVNDIEVNCERLAVLDGGSILFQGRASDLRKLAEGKVFRAEAAPEEFEWIKRRHKVIHMQQHGNRTTCRFLCEQAPEETYIPCTPTVEDAYIRLLQTGEGACEHAVS